jgi:hypothetical protein
MFEEITLKIPINCKLPEYVNRFSINENFLMLKLGAEIVYSSTKEILENQLINIRNDITNEIQQNFQNKYQEQITFLQNQITIIEQQKENDIKRRIDDNLNSVNIIKDIYINTNKELNDKLIDIVAQSKIIEEKYNNEKKLIESHINDEVFKRIENISTEKLRIYNELINKKEQENEQENEQYKKQEKAKEQEIIKLKEKIFYLEHENNNVIVKIEQDKNNLLTQKNIEINTLNDKITYLLNQKQFEITQIENSKQNEFIRIQNENNNQLKLKEIAIDNLNNQIKEFNNKLNKEFELINAEWNNKIQNITKDKNIQLLEKEKIINDLNNKIILNNTEWINKCKIAIKDEVSIINSKYEKEHNELKYKLEQQTDNNKELKQQIFALKEEHLIKENNSLTKILEQQKLKCKETTYTKGTIGESIFKQMAKNAFKFLDFFDIIDTFNLPQMGDFHLKFDNFDVLVDVKNYENSVPKSQRDKIKNDLSFGTNKKIKFAWLISLYSDIDGFSRGSPFEIEIITQPLNNDEQTTIQNTTTQPDNNTNTTTQYIFYINQLNNNPTEILLSILSCCKTIYKIISETNDDFTVSKYKEYELKVKNNIINIIDNNKNIYKMFNDMKKMFNDNDKFLQNILNNELNSVFKNNFTVIEWCKKNMIPDDNKETLIKDAFKKFTDDNSDDGGVNVKLDLFTQILTEHYKNNIKIVKLTKSEKIIITGYLIQR